MLKGSRRGQDSRDLGLLLKFWHPCISRERSSNNTAELRTKLSKFGFERDLNIAKRVLLLNPTPWVDFQLHMAAIFKILEIDMTS